jgi:hypothetical protein
VHAVCDLVDDEVALPLFSMAKILPRQPKGFTGPHGAEVSNEEDGFVASVG